MIYKNLRSKLVRVGKTIDTRLAWSTSAQEARMSKIQDTLT